MKRYTAKEMRDYADAIAGDLGDNDHGGVEYFYDDLIPVIESLRQAADTCEKIEGEIKRLEDLLVPTCSNCMFECAYTHGKEPCKNHTCDGSGVSLVANIKYLREFIND